MYNVFKINCKTDEEITIAQDLSFEEARKLVHGYKMTEEYKTGLAHQCIFERKGSMWIYVIRKF